MRHMKRSGIVGLGGIWSVTAFVANVVVSLALIAVLPIMVIWPFGGSHRLTVEVHDEAGILRTEPLAKKIQEMRFRQDLHVAVLTVPGWDVTNLNDSVLEYARSHASDTDVPWISTSKPPPVRVPTPCRTSSDPEGTPATGTRSVLVPRGEPSCLSATRARDGS